MVDFTGWWLGNWARHGIPIKLLIKPVGPAVVNLSCTHEQTHWSRWLLTVEAHTLLLYLDTVRNATQCFLKELVLVSKWIWKWTLNIVWRTLIFFWGWLLFLADLVESMRLKLSMLYPFPCCLNNWLLMMADRVNLGNEADYCYNTALMGRLKVMELNMWIKAGVVQHWDSRSITLNLLWPIPIQYMNTGWHFHISLMNQKGSPPLKKQTKKTAPYILEIINCCPKPRAKIIYM